MKVLLTGGTGFVGSFVAVAAHRAGHDVRLMVRRRGQVARTFAPHGVSFDDVVVGDVTDADAVFRAMHGCDAVVHAAAVLSRDPRRAAQALRTNATATRNVLNQAVSAKCDPVVHISSTVALVRFGPSGPDLPLGDLTLAYTRSKIDSERVARGLQDEGAPVVTVYPGAVWGPNDPYDGQQTVRLTWIAKGLFPLWPRGGMHVVDVRDVAEVVAALLEAGRGPGRYVVPGHHMSGADLYSTVAELIGRRRPHIDLPRVVAVPATTAMGLLQRPLPARWHYPADREEIEITSRDTRFDDTPARCELGVQPRPWRETIADSLDWLVDSGRLPDTYRPRR